MTRLSLAGICSPLSFVIHVQLVLLEVTFSWISICFVSPACCSRFRSKDDKNKRNQKDKKKLEHAKKTREKQQEETEYWAIKNTKSPQNINNNNKKQ